jgi:hypothetical protein
MVKLIHYPGSSGGGTSAFAGSIAHAAPFRELELLEGRAATLTDSLQRVPDCPNCLVAELAVRAALASATISLSAGKILRGG